MTAIFSMQNPLFACYAFHAALLILKTLLMSFLTVRHRIKNKALPAPEDYAGKKDHKFSEAGHPDVERVRRAHLNDLENILPFLLIALFFIGTNPDPVLTQWLFHVFTAARYMHTLAYVFGKSTVFRVLSYFTGLSINIGLGVMSTYAYYKHAHPFV